MAFASLEPGQRVWALAAERAWQHEIESRAQLVLRLLEVNGTNQKLGLFGNHRAQRKQCETRVRRPERAFLAGIHGVRRTPRQHVCRK